ncbi:MAG: VWA domain-containing protein, partial [Dysosmobacter sp.]
MKKRILSLLLILCMAVTLLPTAVFAKGATGETVPDGKAKIGTTEYATLGDALQAAQDNDTIYLGEGAYSSYKSTAVKGKNLTLTFVGAGTGKTIWNMGTSVAGDPNGGEDGDYSFDGSEKVTFKDMTLRSSVKDGTGEMVTRNNTGFVRIQHIVVDNCIIEGRTTYWGYTDTEFHNTEFYAPGHPKLNGILKDNDTQTDYVLWTGTGTKYTFDACTFYANGKIVHLYRDYGAGTKTVEINFNDCTVNNTSSNKAVLNIKDNNNVYIVNISGTNTVTGVKPNRITCSRMFQVEGWADNYNLSGGTGNGNNCRATVKIDGKTVWEKGKMVSHAIDTAYDKYTDGYKDDAFTVDKGAWTTNPDGTKTRTITKTCDYCGYQEKTTQNAEADPIDWDVSKSKTATQLNTNTWTSDVTLSLPSAEENLASDVVFVLDKSECASESAEAAKELVSQLLAQQELEKATLKVGVVAFGGTAIVVRGLEEITDAADLNDAVTDGNIRGLHGTNIQAGLIEADKMLSEDTEVSDNRKYVVLISDGHTYEFSKEGEYGEYVDGAAEFKGLKTYGIYSETDLYAYTYGISYTIHSLHDQYYTGDYNPDGTYKGDWRGNYLTDDQYIFTNTANSAKYVKNEYEMPYGTWDKYLKHISEVVAADGGQYDVELKYDSTGNYGNQCIGSDKSKAERAALADSILGKDNYIKCGLDAAGNDNQLMHASGVDRAVYEAYTKYASMAEKYHCYPIYVKNGAAATTQDYGYQLMHALGTISNNTGTDVSVPNADVTAPGITAIFTSIKNDILYAVGAGSKVTDTIGDKFTFGGVDSFVLTVGGSKIEGTPDAADANTVNFGEVKNDGTYPYTITYTPATKTFVWTINENVSNFAPVQLTYTVKLTTPETDPGTYGVEDLKGEKTLSDAEAEKALFTNESAVLNAKNSAGAPVKEQVFPKPSVSYTVKSSGGGGGGSSTTYYYFAIEKVDAQDGHALNGAKFGLYLDGKQVATATSNRSGIALFRVSESDYRKINAKSELYYQELTAPEGYVVSGGKIGMEKDDLTTNQTTAEKKAETVRNYRGVTP